MPQIADLNASTCFQPMKDKKSQWSRGGWIQSLSTQLFQFGSDTHDFSRKDGYNLDGYNLFDRACHGGHGGCMLHASQDAHEVSEESWSRKISPTVLAFKDQLVDRRSNYQISNRNRTSEDIHPADRSATTAISI
jgi:hypothetical protein